MKTPLERTSRARVLANPLTEKWSQRNKIILNVEVHVLKKENRLSYYGEHFFRCGRYSLCTAAPSPKKKSGREGKITPLPKFL